MINNGLPTTGNSGTIVLGDGTFTKTYGSGWNFNGGVTSGSFTTTGTGYQAQLGSNTQVSYGVVGVSGTGMYFPNTGVVGFAANAANALFVSAPTSSVNFLQISGNTTGGGAVLSAQGSDANIDIQFVPKGTGFSKFSGSVTVSEAGNIDRNRFIITASSGGTILNHNDNTFFRLQVNGENALVLPYIGSTIVNYLQISGNSTGNAVTFSTNGSDTNVSMNVVTKGSGSILFNTQNGQTRVGGGSNTQFVITNTSNAVNYLQASGNSAGNPPTLTAAGTDNDINLNIEEQAEAVKFRRRPNVIGSLNHLSFFYCDIY
jgi:hypothetical protein